MRQHNSLPEEKIKRIREMYVAGEKLIVIATELGVKRDTVTKYVRSTGILLRSKKAVFRRKRNSKYI
jgi:uncharacterized protein YjcR